ncbi:hypothetical protein V7S43_005489 [Phytophthora oleae]|uniref:Temptin Cys/Cys disulfide domain-containing protein n=1 Tax=Phytophthora oleae TaxID=2107226 RepID=A0ABD3FQA6_9STRA
MKTCTAFAATALIVASTFDSALGLAKNLDELPNGSSFSQELGHPDNDSSQYTDFATAFADAGHAWSADFCAKTFPGSSMTNGEAFGDPCCMWTKGETPDAKVTAFTTSPTKATVCPSTVSSSTGSATSSTGSTETEDPITDAPVTDTPSVTTETPVTDAPDTPIPVTDPPSDSGSEGSDSSDSWFPRPGGFPTTAAADTAVMPSSSGCATDRGSLTSLSSGELCS